MVLRGADCGLTVFGSGDHNHNLERHAWRRGKREASRLGRKYPQFLIFHNCEITFQLGHFLVVEPGKISGTVAEGYDFLLGRREALKIINHPAPDKDEWQKRLLPTAAGVEVITGAEYRKALAAGYTFESVRDLPFFRTYTNYLSLGFPVAAIGNSDAHALADAGSGMTGLYLSGGFERGQVLQAIRGKRSFATTDPGIRLRWGIDPERREFYWHVDWRPVFLENTRESFSVEVFNKERRVCVAGPEGRIAAEPGGLYWTAAFNSKTVAVSSPAGLRPVETAGEIRAGRSAGSEKLRELLMPSLTDLRRLELCKRHSRLPSLPLSGAATVDLLSAEPEPVLQDAGGRPVPFTVLEPGRRRVIIDKQCRFPCFEEFYLWLKRNEIHEYRFLDIEYSLKDNLFSFTGRIVPAFMVAGKAFGRRYRGEAARLRSLLTPGLEIDFRLQVQTLYRSTVRIELEGYSLPLSVGSGKTAGLRNLLVGSGGGQDSRDLKKFLGSRISPAGGEFSGPGLFQLFV